MDFALVRPFELRGMGCWTTGLALGLVFALGGSTNSQAIGQEVGGAKVLPEPAATGHVLPPAQRLKDPGPGIDGPGPGVLNPSSLDWRLAMFVTMRFLSSRPVPKQPGQICENCIFTLDFEPEPDIEREPDFSRRLPLDTEFVALTEDHPRFRIEDFRHRTRGLDQREVTVTWVHESGDYLDVPYAITRAADEEHFNYFKLSHLIFSSRGTKISFIEWFDKSRRDRPIAEDDRAEVFLAIKHGDTWYQVSQPVTFECESKIPTRPPTPAEIQVFHELSRQMEKWANALVPIPSDVELPVGTKIWQKSPAGHWYQEGIVEKFEHNGQLVFSCEPQVHRGTASYAYKSIGQSIKFFILPDVLNELPKRKPLVETAPN